MKPARRATACEASFATSTTRCTRGAPWARGRGYATETARALADWGLAHGAPRVHLYVDVRNAPSLAVARRAGFAQEGVVRGCLEYRDGTRGDGALFGRLAGD